MNKDEFDLDDPNGMMRAVFWQTQLCSCFNEGGKWYVPRSDAEYTIYNNQKIAVRTKSDEAVDRVFLEMGWKVQRTLI